MRGFGSSVGKGVAAVVLLAGATLAGVSPVSAGVPSFLQGSVACDVDTGDQIITWTLTNSSALTMDVLSETVDATALTAGSALDTVAGMTPATGIAAQGGTSVGETSATPDALGTYTLTLSVQLSQGAPFNTTGSVVLVGCTVPATTTVVGTTVPSETSTTALDSGGGTLPESGSDNSLMFAAAALVAAGCVLMITRRKGVSR